MPCRPGWCFDPSALSAPRGRVAAIRPFLARKLPDIRPNCAVLGRSQCVRRHDQEGSGWPARASDGWNDYRERGDGRGFVNEGNPERELPRAFQETKGRHLVRISLQNIDQLVTVFRATKRAGRLLLVDRYPAVDLEATGRDTVPQSG